MTARIFLRLEGEEIAEFPLYERQIIARFPETSFPIPFEAPDGYEEVLPIEQPPIDYWQNAISRTAILVDGVWVQQWDIEDASSEEVSARTEARAAEVRSKRNAELAASDWTQIWDATCDKDAWAEYRQALRDITSQPGFPWEISWPEKP